MANVYNKPIVVIGDGENNGGVDLDDTYYFVIGSNSSIELLGAISYSTDYGKTWQQANFYEDPYGYFAYSISIEVKKGFNMKISSSGEAKYGMVLLKSSSTINSLTCPNLSGSVMSIRDIHNGMLLVSQEQFISFVITMGSSGGAD